MADDSTPNGGGSAPQATEDMLAKYKRLLSLARSSLEANQTAMTAKDQQISQLLSALEEERSRRLNSVRATTKDDDNGQLYPRRIISRLDVEGTIWVLLEYESSDDEWKSFTDELALQDFIKRIPGIPLICPQKCLSAEESARTLDETKRRVDKVVEEFRRYKVRMEIALKQKDAESKPLPSPQHHSFGSALPQALEKAMALGAAGDGKDKQDELQRMKQLMHEQEMKWRQAYDKLSKEMDVLKTKGAEAVVAAQWRSRYESCVRDRDDLQRKLQLYSQLSSELANSDRSLEELYLDVSEAFKGLRRRLLAFIQQYSTHPPEGGAVAEDLLRDLGSILEVYRLGHHEEEHRPVDLLGTGESKGKGASGSGGGMAESKVRYLRQMMYQYFLCVEDDVKQHIESALMAILRFTDEEKNAIESKRVDDGMGMDSTLSSFTTFLGFSASTS